MPARMFGMVKAGHGVDSGPAQKGDEMQAAQDDTAGSKRAAAIDPRIQTEIGKHLRAIYDDVINEPVPSRFMDLLSQLEKSASKKN